MKKQNKLVVILMSLILITPTTALAQEIPATGQEAIETEVSSETGKTAAIENTESSDDTSNDNIEDNIEDNSEITNDTDSLDNENSEDIVDSPEENVEISSEENTETITDVNTEETGEVLDGATAIFHVYYNGCDLKDDMVYAAGDSITLPWIDDETFIGWALTDNAIAAEYIAGDTITFIDTDINLYAVFAEEDIVALAEEPEAEKIRMSYDNSMSFRSSSDISIDGSFGDWDGLPYSYEYNWDNSQNCWYWGVWIPTPEGDICYKTPEGEYSTDVRHKMQLYCDGKNVYLHVIISRDYGSRFNGEDYQFYIDGQMAAFQVEWPGGGTITGNLDGMTSPGTYAVEVKHRNSSMSYDEAIGSSGYLKVCDDYINNELEIAIPLSELVRQNENINTDTMSVIEFFTPNLMYRRITCAGTPTFPKMLMVISAIIAASGVLLFVSKKGFSRTEVSSERLDK